MKGEARYIFCAQLSSSNVEVLEPEWLREALAENLRAILKLYE